MAGPRQIVDPPTFTPSQYGLFTVVQRPGSDSPHWQNGVTWSAHCTTSMGDTTYDECIATTGAPDDAVPEPSVKTTNVEDVLHAATPFTAYVRFDCSPVGNEAAQSIATEALAKTEEWQVERTFWTGLVDGHVLAFPHLASTTERFGSDESQLQAITSIVVTGGPADPAIALGAVEQALADCYGGVGVIHVPTRVLPTLVAWDLVFPVGSRDGGSGRFGRQLQTASGNLVAVGAGYPGTSPAGVDPGPTGAWIYGTGAVFMYQSSVKINPFSSTVNRDNNTIEMIAERTFVLGYDCCLVAAPVALGVLSS